MSFLLNLAERIGNNKEKPSQAFLRAAEKHNISTTNASLSHEEGGITYIVLPFSMGNISANFLAEYPDIKVDKQDGFLIGSKNGSNNLEMPTETYNKLFPKTFTHDVIGASVDRILGHPRT